MRIAQLTYSTKPRGGVVHTLALAEALAHRGHEVEIWTLGRGNDTAFFRPVDPAVRIRIVDFPEHAGESVGERIARSIEVMGAAFDIDADIVHAQDCISANAAAQHGLAAIRTIHHLDAFTTPQLVACHDRAVTGPIARICVSEAVAREVAAGYGVYPTVIPNGVAAQRFEAAAGAAGADGRATWRATLGDYVLALGGIEPRKGSIDLLEGFALARRQHPHLQLVFGGGETLFDYRDYRARFDARAEQLGITPVILGTVAEDALPTLVAAARVLGFVSTKEGFGLAAMEALAASVPVIARDLPVIREVFGQTVSYASTVADIAQRITDILDGTEPVRTKAGIELAASHTWQQAAIAHEAFYRQVLEHGGDDGQKLVLTDHR